MSEKNVTNALLLDRRLIFRQKKCRLKNETAQTQLFIFEQLCYRALRAVALEYEYSDIEYVDEKLSYRDRDDYYAAEKADLYEDQKRDTEYYRENTAKAEIIVVPCELVRFFHLFFDIALVRVGQRSPVLDPAIYFLRTVEDAEYEG